MSEKIKFNFVKNNFDDFIAKLEDLTTIDNTLRLKIDDDNILIYSALGTTSNIILAFKNYLLDTKEYLTYKQNLEYTYDIILPNCDKLVKNLKFLKGESDISIEIEFKKSKNNNDDIIISKLIKISNSELKIKWLSGEDNIIKDLNKNSLNQRLDIKNKKWSFKISNSQFLNVKKLSNINSDKIINVNISNNIITIFETNSWELEIGKTVENNFNFILNKKFLKCINDELNEIEFFLFENFILIKEDNSNLMLSYEQDFSND